MKKNNYRRRLRAYLAHTVNAVFQKAVYWPSYILGRSRLALRGAVPVRDPAFLPASSLFNSNDLEALAPFARDIGDYHPDLQETLQRNKRLRQWEYGNMLRGLPNLKGRAVLDIGSGPSYMPIYLRRRQAAQVTIIDLPAPFTIAFRKLSRRMRRADIDFSAGDMRRLPFSTGSFDIVISVSVIEHLSHSADHQTFAPVEQFERETVYTLREMYRVLRPGGWLYITSEAYLPDRVDSDAWAGKLVDGRPYAAYPLNEVPRIFVGTLEALGAQFPYPVLFDTDLLLSRPEYACYRHRFITAFCLFAQKPSV